MFDAMCVCRVYNYVCIYVCVYICIYTYVCIYICVCVYIIYTKNGYYFCL